MSNTPKIIYDEKNQRVLLNGKPYTKNELSSYSIKFFIFGALLIIISFFIMPLGILTILCGIYLLIQGAAYNSSASILEGKINALKQVPPTPQVTAKPPIQTRTPSKPFSTNSKPGLSYENHNIAGTSYRQQQIASLGYRNDEYEQSRKELIENYIDDEKIYEIIFSPTDIKLIEEPENEYDPNAIKVLIDNVHVGYIKKGSCSHIKKLLASGKIKKITADIHGGKYKYIYNEYDEEKMDDVIRVTTGDSDYFVSIRIYLANTEENQS